MATHHHFFSQLDSQEMKIKKTGGLVPGGFGQSKGRKAVYFSVVSPLDQNPVPTYKPYFHLKNHHDLLFVVHLGTAQNSLGFCRAANGSVS